MPNHVHLILTPRSEDGLRRAVGEAHRRYTVFVNARARWTGHLFQARFASVVMDEGHLLAAARYVSLNPVRARLVARVEDWPWSSMRAHITGKDDGLVAVRPLLDRVPDFAALVTVPERAEEEAAFAAIRSAEGTGRPLGDRAFVPGSGATPRSSPRPAQAGPSAEDVGGRGLRSPQTKLFSTDK